MQPTYFLSLAVLGAVILSLLLVLARHRAPSPRELAQAQLQQFEAEAASFREDESGLKRGLESALFVAQRNHRVGLSGTARRNVARQRPHA